MLIKAEKLCKIYNRHQPDEMNAVNDVSLEIERNEVVAITGPSGSGKTSLLSLLGCMSRPTSGRVQLAGRTVSQLPESFLPAIRREHFGFIFQHFNLIREISVIENVLLPLVPTGIPMSQMKLRGDKVLAQLALGDKAKVKANRLSGGEQQRVAIARALIAEPQVIIADEPTAHLDSRLATELLDILTVLHEAGKTILIATHDPYVYEHPLISRVLSMSDGTLRGAVRS